MLSSGSVTAVPVGGGMNAPLLFVAADAREVSSWVSQWQNVTPVSLSVNWAAGQAMERASRGRNCQWRWI